MAYKLQNEKEFIITEDITIICYYQNTSYGFRHVAKLFKDNYQIDQKSCAYYNRTWESFTYERVLFYLVRKTRFLTPEEKAIANQFIKDYQKIDDQEVNAKFGMIANIMQIGNILTDNKQDQNNWKARMLKAGIPEIDLPENWNELSEEEKEERLLKVEREMKG